MKISNNYYEFFGEAYREHLADLNKCIKDLEKLRDTLEDNTRVCAFMSDCIESAKKKNEEEINEED